MKSTQIMAVCALTFASSALATEADATLRAMSTKLASAQNLSFQATRELDPGLIPGGVLPEKARITVNVSRPGGIEARSVSRERTMRFVADGQKLTAFNETKNHYAQVPMRTSIDGLVDKLDKDYGFVPPLADFAVSNPYKEFRQQAHTVRYLGLEKIGGFLGLGGVECHHISLEGNVANAELWIATGDQLPRQMIATFHHGNHPQLRIRFTSWNLAAPASSFTFVPPKGAEKIEMWTTSKMQSTRK